MIFEPNLKSSTRKNWDSIDWSEWSNSQNQRKTSADVHDAKWQNMTKHYRKWRNFTTDIWEATIWSGAYLGLRTIGNLSWDHPLSKCNQARCSTWYEPSGVL